MKCEVSEYIALKAGLKSPLPRKYVYYFPVNIPLEI